MGAIRKIQNPLSYSLLFHGILFLVGAWMATESRSLLSERKSQPLWIEVDPISYRPTPSVQTKKQVVQTEKGMKTDTAAPDAFLGEQTQRVEKQSVSTPKTGTASVAKIAAPKAAPAKSTPASGTLLRATGALAQFGIAIGTGKAESPKPKSEPSPIDRGSLSAQARGEYVKGFANGEQTMLNTREFVFYGYFQRIRESLDRAWEKSLQERLAKYFYRGRQLASETDYMTQLLVSLDSMGRITKVQVIGASGTTDLDEAATKAFNDAGPFPNPPTGLLEQGQVLVRWDFVLKT